MNKFEDFVSVASTVDIPPGEMRRVNAHGAWVVIANIDNEYFAIADTCSHEDASLYKGVLEDGYIRCPLHGSRFDMRTGQPIEEPAEEPVDVYPVRVVDNVVYIGPPLHDDT